MGQIPSIASFHLMENIHKNGLNYPEWLVMEKGHCHNISGNEANFYFGKNMGYVELDLDENRAWF